MTLHTIAQAEKIAADNNATEEDGWTYTARPLNDSGVFAVIEVRDETAEIVGTI